MRARRPIASWMCLSQQTSFGGGSARQWPFVVTWTPAGADSGPPKLWRDVVQALAQIPPATPVWPSILALPAEPLLARRMNFWACSRPCCAICWTTLPKYGGGRAAAARHRGTAGRLGRTSKSVTSGIGLDRRGVREDFSQKFYRVGEEMVRQTEGTGPRAVPGARTDTTTGRQPHGRQPGRGQRQQLPGQLAAPP